MIKKRLNLRNVAKVMIVASLAVAAVFISCGKDDSGDSGGSGGSGDSGGGSIGGKQSPIGKEGTYFSVISGISGSIANNVSAQVIDLENGVSTVSVSANITNSTYLSMLACLAEVNISGTTASATLQYRFTDAGIQEVCPEGNFTVIKYNAKEGDVYTLKRGAQTIRREVTSVSNKDEFLWNGLLIKTIRVKETGRGIPGVDYIEYATNHKFGPVQTKIFFEDGTSLNIHGTSSVTN